MKRMVAWIMLIIALLVLQCRIKLLDPSELCAIEDLKAIRPSEERWLMKLQNVTSS